MAREKAAQTRERQVEIAIGRQKLGGILGVPVDAHGVVIFAHGSGSSRLSPRNTFVARELQKHGLISLLVDLLTEAESADRRAVFDIDLLAARLADVTRWARGLAEARDLGIGYFGASTGAGAALQAAAGPDLGIGAIVSRGGRPDLAVNYLSRVRAPTLLIVGGDDEPVISLNRLAYQSLRCPKEIVIVPGATHLFEEPGTLEEVANLAAGWFGRHLNPAAKRGRLAS
jgi:putative phosphoribosyl transferase